MHREIERRLNALEEATTTIETVDCIRLVGINPDGTETEPVTIWERTTASNTTETETRHYQ